MHLSRLVSKRAIFNHKVSKYLSTTVDSETASILNKERVSEDVDVCIVGAGPAGLSAAIKIRQLSLQQGKDVRVFVVEKGPEVGIIYIL